MGSVKDSKWTLEGALRELESLGSEQTRKTYRRHGVTGEQYGVKFGDLSKLVRKIKVDHELAEELWESGNHDARVLATMIADPSTIQASRLDAWAKGLDNHVIANQLADLAAKHPAAAQRAKKWTRSRSECISSAGWSLVSSLAKLGGDDAVLTDEALAEYIDRIEAEIHRAPNRTRYSMNWALMSIGVHRPKLKDHALAAAKRIGPVEVDHGDTNCKTPDAVKAIQESRAGGSRKKKG